MRGYDSEVYIVRIRQHGGGHFADEAWAIAPCRAAGMPAPELLLCETVTMGEHPREVIVQRRVAGRALSEIEDMLTPEQRAVLEGARRQNSRGLL